MAVQLPGAGTPIDATLLGSYALEINRLAGTVANSTKRSRVNSPPLGADGGQDRSVITSELSFVGTYKDISNSANTATARTITVQFDNDFAQIPVVVATPYSANPVFNPDGVDVILTDVTTKAASFRVRTQNKFSGYLNVIAIGVAVKL